jgi:hypothetical protein
MIPVPTRNVHFIRLDAYYWSVLGVQVREVLHQPGSEDIVVCVVEGRYGAKSWARESRQGVEVDSVESFYDKVEEYKWGEEKERHH